MIEKVGSILHKKVKIASGGTFSEGSRERRKGNPWEEE